MMRSAKLKLNPVQLRSCPRCGSAMLLMAVELDNKIYECSACQYMAGMTHDQTVAGWVNSSLQPPLAIRDY